MQTANGAQMHTESMESVREAKPHPCIHPTPTNYTLATGSFGALVIICFENWMQWPAWRAKYVYNQGFVTSIDVDESTTFRSGAI